MDAPLCQKIPSCGKRHYGSCASASSQPRCPESSARPKRSKKKSTPIENIIESAELSRSPPITAFDRVEAELKATLPQAEVLARLESLEDRVLELENRKKYMRDYMREKRK